MLSRNKKVEEHFAFTPSQKYGYIPDVPLCDRKLKRLDIRNIFLTKERKGLKCVKCRRLLPILLGITVWPSGTTRLISHTKSYKERTKKKEKKSELPNWRRFRSHKNLDNKEEENAN